MNKKRNKNGKRIFCLLLCFTLLFSQEVPVFADGLTGFSERTLSENGEEPAVFAGQQGRILTKPQDTQAGTSNSLTQPGEMEMEPAALRMPDFSGQTEEEGRLIKVGKNYKTWEMPDHTYKTVFTSYSNTYEEAGEEKLIDNTLVSGNGAGETYHNKANEIDVVLSAGEEEGAKLSVSANEVEAVMKPEDGDYANAAVSENAIRYNGVYENIDVQYTVQANGVKQDIILMAPQERTQFTYFLEKDGIYAKLRDNCVYVYPKTGEDTVSGNEGTLSENSLDTPTIIISAPQMIDGAGSSSDQIVLALKELEDKYELTLTADPGWIQAPERVYPIKIDPSTVVLKQQIDNFTVSNVAGPIREDTNSCTGFFDNLGKTRSYVITSFLYQSIMIEAGLAGVEVLSAKLDMYQTNENTGFDIGCYRLKDSLYYPNITWENSIVIDRYAAGNDSIKPAGKGWHSFDIRDSVSGWMNAIYDSHGLVLISSDETKPGAVFASENYPDTAYAPSVTIEWAPAEMSMGYGLDDTTVNLRPMTLSSVDGKLQCYGVFADGMARPEGVLQYQLSDSTKNYKGVIPIVGNKKRFPDSSAFQSAFPAGTLRYKDVLSNWQTPVPFTEFAYDKLYSIKAQAAYQDEKGKEVKSDNFLIYRVTKYDTMKKIADYYGVPLSTLLFDNKAADLLLVENNTLFIRNPKQNQNKPYQPGELTDEEKAAIDSALLGRAKHCEFGFEPINLNTGNFYLAQEDFSYEDSFGTFSMQRSYNALNANRAGSFGRGFTSLFDESISALSDGSLSYNRQDGSSLVFTKNGDGTYQAPEGYQLKLRREKTGETSAEFSGGRQTYPVYRYVVTREDDSECIFDAGGNLIQTVGDNGEILSLLRDSAGGITGITREGVTMKVTTTPEGFISSITMPNGGVFSYEYDSRQNLSKVTNPLGKTKRFLYDENHRMTSWYDENDTRIVFNTYDDQGRVIKQLDENGKEISLSYQDGKTTTTDARGNQTVYEYDGAYQTTAIHYADGSVLRRSYQDGLMIKETDRAGMETVFAYDENGNIIRKQIGEIVNTFTYDGDGNLLTVTDALGNTTEAEYDTAGNLLKTVGADGSVTAYVYDGRNRLKQKTDPEGNVITYTYNGNFLSKMQTNGRVTAQFAYNALGQIYKLTDGEGNTTSFVYDAMGRNTVAETAEGNVTTISYDPIGLVKSVTDARGGVTSYTYSKSNDILSMTDALSNRYEYTYDENGNRLSETDPDGNRTEYAYDKVDRLIKVTDSLGGTYTYEYDGHDNVVCETDPAGNNKRSTYDLYYRQPLSVADAMGLTTDYTYDKNGNLLSVARDGVTLASYEYDSSNRNTKTAYTGGLTEYFAYDKNGNCIEQTDENGRKHTFVYDDNNQLTDQTTPLGYTYHYEYDKAGNLIFQTAPDGGKESLTYDGDGNPETYTDAEGNTTTYEYDGNGNVTLETLPDGTQYHYVYDALGRLTDSADGLGYVTSYAYDKRGNLTQITDALNGKTVYGYDSLNRNTSVTDALGRETLYTYDACGLLLEQKAADGAITGYIYDKNGRLLKETDAKGGVYTYEYDAFDRLTKETDPLGQSANYTYDTAGNLISKVDEALAETTYEYDVYGNVLSETDPNGNRTEYGYDTGDRLTKIIDAQGNTAGLTYDAAGNPTSVTDPMGSQVRYTYDKTGKLIGEAAADGGNTTYQYDKLGNLTLITDSLNRTTAFSYDAAGNLIKKTDAKGNETLYAYDALGRQTGVTREDGSQDLSAYDAVGNLIYTKEAERRLTEYTYDEMNRLNTIKDALGKETVYTYDLNGNLTEETAPDGSKTLYKYDALDRLTQMTDAGDGVYTYTYDQVGRILAACGPTGIKAAYKYDKAGNLTALTRGNNNRTQYRYDNLNQIVQITDALGGKTDYTYDKAGNQTTVTYADGAVYHYQYDAEGRVTGVTDPAGLQRKLDYDTEGQLLAEMLTGGRKTGYKYDELGNLTAQINALGGKTAYTYDERSRVIRAVTPGGNATSYEYDALSNITKVTDGLGASSTFLYDEKGRLTEETIGGKEHYTYTYDERDRMTSVTGKNARASYTYDAMNRLTGTTDGNGNTTSYEYDKAGKLLRTTDALGNQAVNTYDENGNLQSHTDENGSTIQYDYDALNRLVKKDTGENLSEAAYTYDTRGRLVLMDDVTGESLYTYDTAGRLLDATDGNGQKVAYHYDIYGNITEVVYPDGKKTSYTYDALNHMTSVTTLEGKTTTYTYDADGHLIRAAREDGETRTAYDATGQILGVANYHKGELISLYGYAYDSRGNIVTEKIRLVEETQTIEQEYSYAYDGMSQLAAAHLKQTVKTKEGKTEKEESKTAYVYDMAGNRLSMELTKEGVTEKVTYTYDAAGRMISQSDDSGETTYTYDTAGNLIREDGSRTRYYQYDVANRLTAVMNQDDLLLAALYDGNDNRVFVMEYDPAEPVGNAGQSAESIKGSKNRRNIRNSAEDMTALSGNELAETIGQTASSTGEADNRTESGETTGGKDKTRKPLTAFWYGVLCQAADIILPAPDAFKLWLHNRMGFTDDVSVLFETKAAVYEADLSAGGYSVQEAGSPFELINRAVNSTTGRELSADAYRQTSYVNNINTAYTQVLSENVTWGGAKEAVAYSYGVYRESYKTSGTAEDPRYTLVGMTGSYYYSGTGSVSNLVGSKGSVAYAYKPDGEAAAYSAEGVNEAVNGYTYRGEYTHGSLGIQYLRARYLKVETGTFTSRDTYAGRTANILSQNRYTYAENNPVNFADPSGHAKTSTKGPVLQAGEAAAGRRGGTISFAESIRIANGGTQKNTARIVNNPAAGAAAMYQNRRDALGLPPQNTLLDNARIHNGQHYYSHLVANARITDLMGPAGRMTWEESLAAKVEARRCLAYDHCVNKEQWNIECGRVFSFSTYGYTCLDAEQIMANADYIYKLLAKEGWSDLAIVAFLGNAFTESRMNPGAWQKIDSSNHLDYGYGLVQWSAAGNKFLAWLKKKDNLGLDIDIQEYANDFANSSPIEYIEYQIEYFIYSCIEKNDYDHSQWNGTTSYNSPEKMTYEEFITTNNRLTPEEMALVFRGSYERTENEPEERQEFAGYFYRYYTGEISYDDMKEKIYNAIN